MSRIGIWSTLTGLELRRLLRQQPYQLFRLTVMATIAGVTAIAYAWSGPKGGLNQKDLEGIADWLLPIVAVALYAATYFCFPMILSTALLERGAESPTMLLRLTRISGRDILLVKLLAGIGAFLYACLPVAPILGFIFAMRPAGLLAFFIIEAFLLWVMIHVGLIVLAFSVSATRAADAYRKSLFAFVMLWFIPFASPGGWVQYFADAFPAVPWQVFLAINIWFSLLLPWLAFKRAGRQLDDPDGLVGLNYTPPDEVQASAPIEWAQFLFGWFLLILGIGLTIPGMSISAYFLQETLEDGRLASWLFIQIPATIVLMITLTLRLTFSNYFEPTGAMYTLLLSAPTSPFWWFTRLLLFRSRAVLGALIYFVVAGLMSLQVDAERRVPMMTLIVAEVVITTIWLFALTVVCRPRFLALPALGCYLVLTYIVPLLLPHDVGGLPFYALATAVVATVVTLAWPHPALIVVQAAAWSYARSVAFLVVAGGGTSAPMHLKASPMTALDNLTVMFSLATMGSGGRFWTFGGARSASVEIPAFPTADVARGVMVGDLVVLVVAIVWLRYAFDAMVGRSNFQGVPRFLLRRRGDARAAVRS